MEVSAENIFRIIESVGVLANVKELDASMDLQEQGMDSLDMMNVFLEIEEKYNVQLPDEEIKNIKSVDDIVKFIKGSLLQGQQ